MGICKTLNLPILSSSRETLPAVLKKYSVNVHDLLQNKNPNEEFKSLASAIDRFSKAYFNQPYNPLLNIEKKTFFEFLTDNFQLVIALEEASKNSLTKKKRLVE